MLLDELGEIIDLFKNSFPFSFLFFVPIFIIISPVSPVNAAHEFAVYRMQQFDLHGSQYGCKNALISMEARPVDAKMVTRRCVVAKLRDITISKYRDLITQNAGALLILLQQNLTGLCEEDKQHLQSLERDLLEEENSNMPVFFAWETDTVNQIYDDIMATSSGDQAATAVEALFSSASANGFQMEVSGAKPKSLADFQITNIQGHLSGYGIEEQLPTVAVVAHYDAFGIAPGLSTGADSNGSGVIALLELARLFSKLYTNSRTHAKFNLVFLLSGGGKYNFQGTKKWIEDGMDASDSSLLSDFAYVLCLDSIGSGNELYLHVSKPPKEDSAGGILLKHLQEVTQTFFSDAKFDLVHKKINLAEDMLAWEHERFSMKRLPAFTLSHFPTHKSLDKRTILDNRDRIDLDSLVRNIQIIAESLARHIYNLTSQGNIRLFSDALDVQKELISAWLDHLTNQPRASQLLPKDSSLLSTLEETMSKYLKDVKRTTVKADKRDPDFLFYSGAVYQMNAFSVKPAVFDLFLAAAIGTYLALVYLFIQNFYIILGVFSRFARSSKVKAS